MLPKRPLTILLSIVFITLIAGLGVRFVFAQIGWYEPTDTPPYDNEIPLWIKQSDDNIFLTTGGNVGIGSTSPGQKLDVAGYVKGQSGLCIGNDCRTSWPSTPLSGSGSTNYLTKWTGTTSFGNSLIYDDGTRVSLGADPVVGKTLYVQGNETTAIYGSGYYAVQGYSSSTNGRGVQGFANGSGGIGLFGYGNLWALYANGRSFFAGDVGVGATNSDAKFNATVNLNSSGNVIAVSSQATNIGTGKAYGVFGLADVGSGAAAGYGVYGEAVRYGIGVYGSSTEGTGVYGTGKYQGGYFTDSNYPSTYTALSRGVYSVYGTGRIHGSFLYSTGNLSVASSGSVGGNFTAGGELKAGKNALLQLDGGTVSYYAKEIGRTWVIEAGPSKVGTVVPIPKFEFEKFCKNPEGFGCELTLGMKNWDSANKPSLMASRGPYHFSYTGSWWRVSNNSDSEGKDNNGTTNEWSAWDCYFTDAEKSTNASNGRSDSAASFGLLNAKGGSYSDTTTQCVLIVKNIIGQPVKTGYLVNGLRTEQQCRDVDGAVVSSGGNKFCRFDASSCPSGWAAYKLFSTTETNSCSGGGKSCYGVGCGGQTSCTTGEHSWSDKTSELCGYRSEKCTLLGCATDLHTCYADITQVGCY